MMKKLSVAILAIVTVGIPHPAYAGDSKTKVHTEKKIVGTIPLAGKKTKAEMQALAKISANEANTTALAAVAGTTKEVELESEDGFLVYSVEIITPSGKVEVLVDAGNGKILDQEADSSK